MLLIQGGDRQGVSVAVVAQATGIPSLSVQVIFLIIAVALILFVWEPVPIDVVAIGVLVSLVALEPVTGVDVETGISGFASPATVTVLAMFILSEGIRQSGLVNIIGSAIADRYGASPYKQLLAVLGLSGASAGFINNTPVVAIMIPMVSTLSEKTGVSPSKLLMPISYAAMLGGTLTLIGTSTNILASDLSGRLIDRPFSMFEFTGLGVVVLATGTAYMATVGRYLLPERVSGQERFAEFEMAEYLTEVVVQENSVHVGQTVQEAFVDLDVDVDVVQLVRDGTAFTEPLDQKELQGGDLLVLRTGRTDLLAVMDTEGLAFPQPGVVSEPQLDGESEAVEPEQPQSLVEIVISPEGKLIGQTLDALRFRNRFDATVLAIRRGERVIHERMDKRRLRGGDTLLVQASEAAIRQLGADRNFILAREVSRESFRTERIPVALGIVAAVVGLAALEVLPIVVSALGGIVAMVATGCVQPDEMYEAVDWSVIFLLAGLIPLGIAMERTGGAEWLADAIVTVSSGLDPVLVLAVFYLFTALVTNVISNNASVVLMIPVAIDTAQSIGADPFSFVLAVTFAASTALMTPLGYQTNLMVYGPGGYHFSDYLRIGLPLNVLLAVVTILIAPWVWPF